MREKEKLIEKLANKKIVCMFLIIIFIFLSYLNIADAISIGISPTNLEFENVLKNSYAETFISLSTSSNEDILVDYQVFGDLKDWIKIKPADNDNNTTLENITIISNSPTKLKVSVETPTDAKNGEYTGRIMFIVKEKTEGNSENINAENKFSKIITAISIDVIVKVIGDEIVSCTAGGFDINNIEVGYPIGVYSSIINNGNVRIRPTVSLDIWDREQKKILITKEFTYDEVLPTKTRNSFKELENNLPVGQYWADISIPLCNAKSLLTFDVAEKGMISDSGELLRIDAPLNAEVGEIIPIKAVFKNQGLRTVTAKFTGVVMQNNKIIQTIDTDLTQASPGENVELESFFQPKKEGEYLITGRVIYNNKLSYEQEYKVNVKNTEGKETSNNYVGIYFLISIMIAVLLILILRKRKRRKHITLKHKI